MNKPKSPPGSDAIDYYAIASGIRPGRLPSIYHIEHQYYWSEFPNQPAFKIYTATFHKVTPQAHTVDCRKYGQLHYWSRIGGRYRPALIIFEFIPPRSISKINYFYFRGLLVSDPSTGKEVAVESPDNELFKYCLSGFLRDHISKSYSFAEIKL